MNARVNVPGGVDKVCHSSVQPWSAGDVFPAVIYRVEAAGCLPEYRVLFKGEEFIVALVGGWDGARAQVINLCDLSEPVYVALPEVAADESVSVQSVLYDVAHQFALGLVMADAVDAAARMLEGSVDSKLIEALEAGVSLPLGFFSSIGDRAPLAVGYSVDPEPGADWFARRPDSDFDGSGRYAA